MGKMCFGVTGGYGQVETVRTSTCFFKVTFSSLGLRSRFQACKRSLRDSKKVTLKKLVSCLYLLKRLESQVWPDFGSRRKIHHIPMARCDMRGGWCAQL